MTRLRSARRTWTARAAVCQGLAAAGCSLALVAACTDLSGLSGATDTSDASARTDGEPSTTDAAAETGPSPEAGPPGLVAWWKFDDGTGSVAVDSSGNSHDANLESGATWVAGKIGGAVSAAANAWLAVANLPLGNTNAVTVTMWVNRTYSGTGGGTLFESSRDYNKSTTGFGIFPDETTLCGGAMMIGLNGDKGYSVACYPQPPSGSWHHFAAVFDRAQPGGAEIALYLDGSPLSPSAVPYGSDNTNTFGNNPLYIFSRAGTEGFVTGTLDDVRVYDHALSEAEIRAVFLYDGT